MDEDMYVVVKARYGSAATYRVSRELYAKSIYSELETFSDPMPLDEAKAVAKLMNAADSEEK
jgi:hypothetical protein